MVRSLDPNKYVGHNNSVMNPIHEKDDMFDEDVNSSKDFKGKSMISNHYEVPNMTSMLYEFTNKE